MADSSPTATGPTPPAPGSLRPAELQARLARGEAIQMVDVREDEELELARLSHPVLHLPLSRSSAWMATIEERLERGRPVAVLCHAGLRSWHFACWLCEHHGYTDVWNLEGGIDAWSREVDPSVPRY